MVKKLEKGAAWFARNTGLGMIRIEVRDIVEDYKGIWPFRSKVVLYELETKMYPDSWPEKGSPWAFEPLCKRMEFREFDWFLSYGVFMGWDNA